MPARCSGFGFAPTGPFAITSNRSEDVHEGSPLMSRVDCGNAWPRRSPSEAFVIVNPPSGAELMPPRLRLPLRFGLMETASYASGAAFGDDWACSAVAASIDNATRPA